ncbi:toprim domain-containing protein [Vreelandella gomseomensis]|uniref:Toprim domain-containing protein n=1 Tax=Vreelandella gomseomensis TaxID=370766 RepID=A0ABU1G8I0_9GAMM|nr:toprim domain-containing protein [Halomonas gomseomensis]MDR5873797.1 toprim domain-containing protein [Halomonas gomseomensis]
MAKTTIQKIQQVAAVALNSADILLAEWLPDGERQGSEWVARNTARADACPGSFGVSLTSGKWNDFADQDAHGGDLVSLLSYLRNCRQIDAAMLIDEQLGLGIFQRSGSSTAPLPKPCEVPGKAQRRKQAETARIAAQARAAQAAQRLWHTAAPANPAHPYLVDKGVKPHHLRQSAQGQLLVPLYADGQLVNLQCIDPQGQKRFLKGGRVRGAYAPLGKVQAGRQLFICEGWATGATLHAHTGEPVACAMNAGNLAAVAETLRDRYHTLDMVIAGDDDRLTPGNPGRTAANAAALSVGALVLFPTWPPDAPDSLSDFNDLARWHSQQRKAK